MNPLPHALMLTAIVVMVATSGVAFAVLIRLHARYGSLEEDRIEAAIAREDGPDT
jgi:multicomponent Na+:H+ antiporter subunit C